MGKSIDAGEVEALQLGIVKGEVVVAERGDGKFTQVLLDGRHLLLADEPTTIGGDDRGPSPYQLLLMALGSCTSMTVRMYAAHKGWKLARVVVRLRHFRDYATDCENCEGKEGHIERIERVITLEGSLDETQRRRLLEIAEKCPVHRTLEARVSIASKLAP